jgi:hypothetical protein
MFFTIGAGDITTLNGYIGGLIGDFLPIILIVLAVSIGMYIFGRITHH